MSLETARLLVITDRRAAGAAGRDLASAVAAALAAIPPGGAAVQVREKDLDTRELLALTRALVAIARPRRCAVLVNDRLDVALAAGADGVHLPESGVRVADARRAAGACRIAVGVSTHDADAAGRAAAAGADLVVCGPVWATPSKAGLGAPLGVEAISRAAGPVAAAGARLFALGGVTSPERAREAIAAGAHGVAGIRGIVGAGDPASAAAGLWAAVAPDP